MRTADYLVGIIVGLSLGFVLYNVVHAEPTGGGTGRFEPVSELGEATGGDIWGAGYNGQLRIVEVFPLCHGGEVDPLCYDTDAHHFVTSCQVQMEAAMRAMDEFVPPTDVFMMALNMTKTKDHDVALASFIARSTLATKQWERAKACWRKP